MLEQILPDAPYRSALVELHAEMLREIERWRMLCALVDSGEWGIRTDSNNEPEHWVADGAELMRRLDSQVER